MAKKIFNCNNNIYFQITEFGKEHWKKDFNRWRIPENEYTFEKHFKTYTKRGWTKMQLWQFMEIFGEKCGMGMPLLFKTNIKIDETDLK